MVSLPDRRTLFEHAVGDVLPTLGDGFVAWVQRPDPRKGEWQPRLLAARLSDGEVVEVAAEGATLDASTAPAVDGTRVAWLDGSWPQHVRVVDLAGGPGADVPLRNGGSGPAVALGGGRLAFVERDDRWAPSLTVLELATGDRVRIEPDPSLGERELFQPTLAGDLVAVKQGAPWGCTDEHGDPCPVAILARDLATGDRWVQRHEGVSRFGPLLLAGTSVLWLDAAGGPYGFAGARLGAEAASRVTPDGAVLSWIAPGNADGGRLAWADRRGGDFDVYVAALR